MAKKKKKTAARRKKKPSAASAISVRLPQHLRLRVDRWAAKHKHASRGEAIRELLRQALGRLPRRPDLQTSR
ncbi:MAG TPA: ribbon-helix-helix domain-containing protein [Rhizomicrobium sp.]|nr:ribbon-helix-helix domain-containing protein [Rhizomicrobium sp.]